MKNKNIYIGIAAIALVIILLIVSCSIKPKNNGTEKEVLSNDAETIIANAQRESESVQANEQGDFTNINITQYLDYFNNSEKQIVLVARPGCSYCQIAEPIIKNIIYEYKVNINYLNTDDFSEEDNNNFISTDESFAEEFGTPTLLAINEGKITDKIMGLTDHAHYVDFLKRNGYIEE